MPEQFILVVEDAPDWQKLLAEIAGDAGFCPTIISTYNEAVAALRKQPFALAIVDISLSFDDHLHRGGVEVLRHIAKMPTRLPAIVITGYATLELAIETLAELDAVHFFRKDDFDRREFIRVVKQEALPPDGMQTLSEREWQVLRLMSEGKTNHQIAAELVVSVNTIKKHAQSIFTKLNVNSRAAAVARAFKQEW